MKYFEMIETLTRMERSFGPLSKTITGGFNMTKMDSIKNQFMEILTKYKHELGIKKPLPFVRMWVEENRVRFLFFDKETGKRILLGEWLEGKTMPYEQ